MRWSRGLKVSIEMLWAHKLRTVLSVLGIVVGVATVTVMAAVGKGSEQKVLEGIRGMGTNLITVTAGKVAVMAGRQRQAALANTLLPGDAEAIQAGAGDLVSLVAPVQSRKMPVKFAEIGLNTNIVGTSPEFLAIRNLRLQSGVLFDEQDHRASRRVAVVGQTLVRELFGGADPIGQRIRVGRVPLEVIGALAPAGVDANGVDQDDQILVPLRTALRRVFNVIYLNNIYVQARSEDLVDECGVRVRQILRERHHRREGEADDFTIQSQAELLRAQRETQRTFFTLTVSVASLSLVVGGVGILAVMLMSVRERIREIGLRRALGARRRDILVQFLLEAMILSVAGGVAGAAAGIAGVWVLASLASWNAVVAPAAVSLAVASSAAIGLVFGTIPARKASLANPVSSLWAE